MTDRKKVGIALGSGGARGLAHIGVLKVLEENNIPIDMIAGSSMGSVIGALYSDCPDSKEVEKKVKEIDWKWVFDYTFPKKGLIKGDKIKSLLKEKISCSDFKDLELPLWTTSFDLNNNREVIFNEGNIAKAVRASISIPGIFIPVENDGRVLVDGGIVDPIPTEVLKKNGADIIIAINVNKMNLEKGWEDGIALEKENWDEIPNVFKVSTKAIHLIGYEISEKDKENTAADLVIDIDFDEKRGMDFSEIDKIIDKGEKITREKIEEIKNVTEKGPFKKFLKEVIES